mgnify:CR=1 FL=1
MLHPDLLSRPLPPPPHLSVHGGELDPLPYHNLHPPQVILLSSDWRILSMLPSDLSILLRYSVSTSVARSARQGQTIKKQDLMDEFVS